MIVLPRVIGHRGAAAVAPENTLAGLDAAARCGVQWIEIDARLSADSIPVLAHDAAVFDGARRRRVSRTSAAALAACDVGRAFAPAFAGEAVPTLAAALDRAAGLGLGVNLEIKDCGQRNAMLADAVAAQLAHRRRGRPQVLVSSFRPRILARLRARNRSLPLGLLMVGPRRGWRRLADRLGCVSLHCASRQASAKTIAAFKATGRAVAVYTVNDPAAAQRLFELGVDAVFSDDPGRLLQALEKN